MLPSQEISPQCCWNRGLHPFFSLCIYLFSGFSSNYVLSVYIEPEYPVQFPSNQSQSTTTELTTKLPAKDFNVTWLHCLFLRPSTCHFIHDPMQSYTRIKQCLPQHSISFFYLRTIIIKHMCNWGFNLGGTMKWRENIAERGLYLSLILHQQWILYMFSLLFVS